MNHNFKIRSTQHSRQRRGTEVFGNERNGKRLVKNTWHETINGFLAEEQNVMASSFLFAQFRPGTPVAYLEWENRRINKQNEKESEQNRFLVRPCNGGAQICCVIV